MKYWKEPDDSHIRFSLTPFYQKFRACREDLNSDGYYGEPLQPSDTVYLGACDIMSTISHSPNHWPRKVHSALHPDSPLILLASTGVGLPTMVRRLYSYIQNHGAPKNLYMTVPRFDGYEYVNKSGKCYNASTRTGSAYFMHRSGQVNYEELTTWVQQLLINKQLQNPNNTQYMLEERFAFIETLCRLHNINLKWTFNPSDASIMVLYNNLPALESVSDYMKAAFVGHVAVCDHEPADRTIGTQTHEGIFMRFIDPIPWDIEQIKEQARLNYEWLVAKYGDQLIMNE